MKRVTGTKQVLKALDAGNVSVVYIARDADDFLRGKLHKACREHEVEIQWVATMLELGRQCGIAVGSATAAELHD